jgi:hypothetical protein
MSDNCPFLRLPQEVRNEIYSEVLGPCQVVYTEYEYDQDEWILRIGSKAGTPPVDGLSRRRSNKQNLRALETALFSVTSQIRDEVFRVMFTRSRFVFDDMFALTRFCRSFSPYVSMLRAVEFGVAIKDVNDFPNQVRYDVWEMKKSLPSLRHMTILGTVHICTESGNLFYEGVLNYFRRLSRLPVTTVKVGLETLYLSKISVQILRSLEADACKIILRDASLPEEAQKPLPAEETVLKEQKEEAKKRRSQVLSTFPLRSRGC